MDVDGNGKQFLFSRPVTDGRAANELHSLRLERTIPSSHVYEGDRSQVDPVPRVVQRPDTALGPVRLPSFARATSLTPTLPFPSYVPVKVDYTDLYDIMTFFRGNPDGKDAHEELASKIGSEGKRWAKEHVRAAQSSPGLPGASTDTLLWFLCFSKWRKQDSGFYPSRVDLRDR